MANNHVKVSVSLPKEIDRLLDLLVSESRKTMKPMSKSALVATACYDFLERSVNILESQKTPLKEDK